MPHAEAGRALGVHPNSLWYAAPTGRVLLRWDGARRPLIWMVPPPEADPREARLELARRYLHVYGPTTPQSFAWWAGIGPRPAAAAFEALRAALTPVRTPIGEAWILTADEETSRTAAGPGAATRLLPSGDAYFLLQDADRELLVPEAAHRGELWPSRVWPGALLVDGDIVGTWRRAESVVTARPWQRLSAAQRDAVVAEAESLPVPGIKNRIVVRWDD
jgi:hypothetical protein